MTEEQQPPNNQVYLSAEGDAMAIGDDEGKKWVTIFNKKLKKSIAEAMDFKEWQVKL